MIFSDEEFQQTLRTSKEEFIQEKREVVLKTTFPKKSIEIWKKTGEKDKNFLFLRDYYSSDSYSAKLLEEMDFSQEEIEERISLW